jgi:hypothetical protein
VNIPVGVMDVKVEIREVVDEAAVISVADTTLLIKSALILHILVPPPVTGSSPTAVPIAV